MRDMNSRRLLVIGIVFGLATLLAGCNKKQGGKQPPASAGTKARMAQSMIQAGRVSAALEAIAEAIALEPGNPQWHSQLGSIYLQAWRGMDLNLLRDPFVDGALGELQLVLDRPGPAYPRLLRAYEGFPEVGFIAVDVADAAVRVDDHDAAERFLSIARELPRRDSFGTLERVEADLLAETDRRRIAAVLAADPYLQLGPSRPARPKG